MIREENLLQNARTQGEYLAKLLRERLTGPNALAAPFTFDIRGGGAFWAVEFDFEGPLATKVDFKSEAFAMRVQARSLENGLIVMGMTNGANVESTKGDHIIFAPAYNITREEVEKIVDIFVASTESVLRECLTS